MESLADKSARLRRLGEAMRPVLLVLPLALAACRPAPQPPPAAPAAAPAKPAVSDFSQDIDAAGTEPFWGLKLRGLTFTFSQPDHPDATAKAPGAQITPGQAIWAAVTPGGEAMQVTLMVGECSDGMSDRVYPMAAEVVFQDQTWRGCAAKAADWAKLKGG
jgi:uncharacterized membrane protein